MQPTTSEATPVLDVHRTHLRTVFVDWLVDMDPGDVLDLGAGNGALVDLLTRRGVPARGLEASQERVAEARTLDRPVEVGNAQAVARSDDSAAWVTLRHVLHHLARPEDALCEALRIARDGVLIAEPISQPGLAMHTANLVLENALRALDRARGMHHEADLTPAEITRQLPPSATVEVRIVAPLTRLPRAEVLALIQAARGGLPIGAEEQAGLTLALDAAADGQLAPSGSVMIAARLAAR